MCRSMKTRSCAIAVFVVGPVTFGVSSAAAVTLYPFIGADGTLMDSDLTDGDERADTLEPSFNEFASWDGALALVFPDGDDPGFERRVIWEYDLRNVSATAPVTARLDYRLRGAPVWPFPPVEVHVYDYPADRWVSLSDYAAQPATLQGSITVLASIVPGEGVFEGSLNVSEAVSRALNAGAIAVGFRFQIDPDTPNESSQAFIDADDGDMTTKPALTIDDVMPFDTDGDDDVDAYDYLQFSDCMLGPVAPATGCSAFDANFDSHVDLRDFEMLQRFFTGQR